MVSEIGLKAEKKIIQAPNPTDLETLNIGRCSYGSHMTRSLRSILEFNSAWMLAASSLKVCCIQVHVCTFLLQRVCSFGRLLPRIGMKSKSCNSAETSRLGFLGEKSPVGVLITSLEAP